MNIQVFGSSSAGNCVRVFTDYNPGVYIDAGVNPLNLTIQKAPLANATFLITHEHCDHAHYIKQLSDKHGCMVASTKETLQTLRIGGRHQLPVEPLRQYKRNGVKFTAYPVMHEPAVAPVCWLIEIGGERLLYMTDLGQLPDHQFPECNAYFIEANYTPDRLAQNIYNGITSEYVAGRSVSGFGHIGIEQAIKFMQPRLKHTSLIILGHTSKANFDFDEAIDLMPEEMCHKTHIAEPGMQYKTIPF